MTANSYNEIGYYSGPENTHKKVTTKIVPFPGLRFISLRIQEKYINETTLDVDVEV